MSKSAVAFEMSPEELMKPIEDMQILMADMARVSPAARMMTPLMLHPTAASAAAMAITFGAATQMMGLFLGSVQGAMESSRRLGLPVVPVDARTGLKPLEPAWAKAAGQAAVEAVAGTAEIVRDSVVKTTREVGEAAVKSTKSAEAVILKAASAATTGSAAVAEKVQSAVKAVVPAAERVAPTRALERKSAPVVVEKGEKPAAAAKPAAAPKKAAVPASKAPTKAAKPEQPDDLKLISGVGPKLEEVLNKLGIWTYGQIAAWSEPEIAWIEDYLQFKGRIGRDGWIEQAKALQKK